ncbi:hypothetical protein NPIL_646481 [Nephila pilipes]|uniref:Peptidase M12B propeptide domain-containing protein n=1 Tax=Nephila pilipes TaxID=299642 RepID=A0A8X6QPU2_NEPPI|nr:hypothetical protein NPIL_646481 [Nephila pilipes]
MLSFLGFFAALGTATSGEQLRKPGASRQVKSQTVILTTDNIEKDPLDSLSYTFQGFNRSFILHVRPTEGVLSPSFHVLRVKEGTLDSSLQFSRAPLLRKCIYQGFVENENSSAVTLSVCHGLAINTADGKLWESFSVGMIPEANRIPAGFLNLKDS